MPPQFPTSSLAAGKKRSSLASAASPAKKISRPTSAPNLMARSAAKITAPSTRAVAPAAKKISRPTSAPNLMARSAAKITAPSTRAVAPAAKKIARPVSSSNLTLTAHTAAKPRSPSSKIIPKKPGASKFMAVPRLAAKSVHPARRLTCGTAVYVRTRYVNITDRCCLVIWLPARVVSVSDAYHYTVKYAADLHAMFAGKVVRVPVGHVREATHAAAASQAERSKKPEAPKEEEPYW